MITHRRTSSATVTSMYGDATDVHNSCLVDLPDRAVRFHLYRFLRAKPDPTHRCVAASIAYNDSERGLTSLCPNTPDSGILEANVSHRLAREVGATEPIISLSADLAVVSMGPRPKAWKVPVFPGCQSLHIELLIRCDGKTPP